MSHTIIENNTDLIIDWIIDRNPDLNIINHRIYATVNTYNIINNYNITNNNITNNNITNDITNDITNNIFHETEDFIPFTYFNIPVNINYVLGRVTISSEHEDLNCCVCMETKNNTQICELNCLHKFCCSCIITHIRKNRNNSLCPLCRTKITSVIVQTDDDLQNFNNI